MSLLDVLEKSSSFFKGKRFLVDDTYFELKLTIYHNQEKLQYMIQLKDVTANF